MIASEVVVSVVVNLCFFDGIRRLMLRSHFVDLLPSNLYNITQVIDYYSRAL